MASSFIEELNRRARQETATTSPFIEELNRRAAEGPPPADKAPTFEQRVARERELSGEAFERGDYLEGLAKYAKTVGPTDLLSPRKFGQAIGFIEQDPDQAPAMSEGSLMALGDLLSNLGTQTVQAATTVGKVLSDPGKAAGEAWETAKKFAGAAYEAPWETTKAVGGALLSEAGELIQEPAKYAREKPLDVASMALPGGGTKKIAQKVLRTATMKYPAQALSRVSAFVSRKGQQSAQVIQEAVENRFKNPGHYEAMKRSQKSGDPEELVRAAQEGITAVENNISNKFHKDLDDVIAANPGQTVDTGRLHEMIDDAVVKGRRADGTVESGVDFKALRDGDTAAAWRGFTGTEADKTQILKAMNEVDEFLTDPVITGSLHDIHILKQKLASIRKFDKDFTSTPKGAEVVTDIWKTVRQSLDKRPDGKPWAKTRGGKSYSDINKQFETDYDILGGIETAVAGNKATETVARKLINAFKDDTILGTRRRFIDQLQEASGQPLKEMIAGLNSSSWVPQGTGAFSGGFLTALGIGTSSLPVMLTALPFATPAIMGKLASAAGWGERAARRVEMFAERINKTAKILDVSTEGGTTAMILARMVEANKRREENPDVLTSLGRVGRTQGED